MDFCTIDLVTSAYCHSAPEHIQRSYTTLPHRDRVPLLLVQSDHPQLPLNLLSDRHPTIVVLRSETPLGLFDKFRESV